jgi:hypothetical protein
VSGTRYARARHHYPGEPLLPPHASPRGVVAATQDAYLAEIEAEAARARAEYDLLVLPGVELSYNDLDPLLAAHAVAVGLRTFVSLDGGLDPALDRAREEGAALIAAHPFRTRRGVAPGRATLRFARDWRTLRDRIDRWELFNRYDLFGWVAECGLPAVATGTSIARSTSTDGRRSCPVARTTRPWSSTGARTDRPS